MIVDTPIEKYKINGREIIVKRDDLATEPPGPPFAKVRGLLPFLKKLKSQGIQNIGYMETSISMAGWGLSYFCHKLGGIKPTIFYPAYKQGLRDNQEFQLKIWQKYNAEIIPITKLNMLAINFHKAKKQFYEMYPKGEMLIQGLPFEETKEDVCLQIIKDTYQIKKIKTIVCCSGSGVMLAGIIKGLSKINHRADVFGIFVNPKSCEKQHKKIIGMAGLKQGGFSKPLTANLTMVDAGFQYAHRETTDCPFPCNDYYDRKAWKWMLDNWNSLTQPVLFWNVGANHDDVEIEEAQKPTESELGGTNTPKA